MMFCVIDDVPVPRIVMGQLEAVKVVVPAPIDRRSQNRYGCQLVSGVVNSTKTHD
jgi:hypothetical protein